jgi:hypothetical protein
MIIKLQQKIDLRDFTDLNKCQLIWRLIVLVNLLWICLMIVELYHNQMYKKSLDLFVIFVMCQPLKVRHS